MPRKATSKKLDTPSLAQKSETEDRVNFVVERFNTSWQYAQSNYHSRWEDAWKLYNNKRVKTGYDGISNVFVPMTFSTIETMVAALAGSKPSFDYVPQQSNPTQDTAPLNALIDTYWDKDQWNIKVQSWVRSMLLYGTGVVYLYWDSDHPVMVNIPLRDFFFDPSAVSMEGTGSGFYAGRRYLTTVDELKSFEVVDPETGEMKKKYKNLDDVVGGTKGDETDKDKKDLFYGSTVNDPEKKQVEVLELWTEDRVVSVVNRAAVIEDVENPYKAQARKRGDKHPKGIIPFVVQRDYVDESLFYGRGEVDIIADLQEDLNDFTNQKRDFFTYILNPMWNLNPNKADLIEQIQAAPGAVFPLDPTDLTRVDMPGFPNAAFNEENSIENKIREATAVDQIVKGVSASTSTTATEINAQVASAGQRIGMKVTQFENEGFHRLARVVLDIARLYVDKPTLVKVQSKDGTQWVELDLSQYTGPYEPMVQLQSSVEARKQDETGAAKEIFAALIGDPSINKEELYKIVLPKAFDLDPDEVQRLLTPAQPAPGRGGMPPADMPTEDQLLMEQLGMTGGQLPPEMPPEAMGELPL